MDDGSGLAGYCAVVVLPAKPAQPFMGEYFGQYLFLYRYQLVCFVCSGSLAISVWRLANIREENIPFHGCFLARFLGGIMLVIILILGILGVHNLWDTAEHIVKAGPKVSTTSTINKVIYFGTAFWVGRVAFYATFVVLLFGLDE